MGSLDSIAKNLAIGCQQGISNQIWGVMEQAKAAHNGILSDVRLVIDAASSSDNLPQIHAALVALKQRINDANT